MRTTCALRLALSAWASAVKWTQVAREELSGTTRNALTYQQCCMTLQDNLHCTESTVWMAVAIPEACALLTVVHRAM